MVGEVEVSPGTTAGDCGVEPVVTPAVFAPGSDGGGVVVTGEFATIEGDDVLLRQALSNLLRNGIEACAAAKVVPDVRVDAHVDRESSTCTLLVSDNGPGFAEQTRERVFHPFFTTKPQGTGLGLALVQKIVVTHNGRVSAGSGPGGRITVTLPVLSS